MTTSDHEQTVAQAVQLLDDAAGQLRYMRPEQFDDAEHEKAYDQQIQDMDSFVQKHRAGQGGTR